MHKADLIPIQSRVLEKHLEHQVLLPTKQRTKQLTQPVDSPTAVALLLTGKGQAISRQFQPGTRCHMDITTRHLFRTKHIFTPS